MAEYKKNNKPMICLIDEIFKGTNSADRIVGATEAITRLAGSNSITIVSTHDFELCKLEDKEGNLAENYHFEEYYEDGQLKFDYKIKDGRCTTTNARAILRMAGFEVADQILLKMTNQFDCAKLIKNQEKIGGKVLCIMHNANYKKVTKRWLTL